MRRLGLWTATLAAFGVGFWGLYGLVGILAAPFAWWLAHLGPMTPLVLAIAVSVLAPLAGATYLARGVHRWLVALAAWRLEPGGSGGASAPAPGRPVPPLGVVLLGTVALVVFGVQLLSLGAWLLPDIPRDQRRLVLARGQGDIGNPVLLDGNLYWLVGYEGLRSMPAAGGEPRLVRELSGYTLTLLTDGHDLFWAEDGRLALFTPPDGPFRTLVPIQGLDGVASDGDAVYWVDGMGFGDSPVLSRVSRAGGDPVVLHRGATLDESPFGLTLAGDDLYFTGGGAGTVSRASKSGGAAVISRGDKWPSDIASDGEHLFWTCHGTIDLHAREPPTDGAVMRAALDGRGKAFVASGLSGVSGLALDEANVYWGCADRVMWAPKAGGAAVTLQDGQRTVLGVQVDDRYVYWSDMRGAIYRKEKPGAPAR